MVVAAGGRSRPKKGRGRPPKYGKDRIDLANAAQTRGWQTGLFSLYGRLVVKSTAFLATYKPVGRVIRVVLVPARSLGGVLLDRPGSERGIDPRDGGRPLGVEQVFHDVKEVQERDSNNYACVGQRGGVEPDQLVAHAGGAVAWTGRSPGSRPERLAVGQARASSVACQSLSGVRARRYRKNIRRYRRGAAQNPPFIRLSTGMRLRSGKVHLPHRPSWIAFTIRAWSRHTMR